MTIVFDTHTWIKRLREAGFTEEQAEKEAGLMRKALTANFEYLATKADLERLKSEMDSRFASLESKIDSRFANLEAETRRRLDKGPTATVSIVGHASLCPTYTLDTGVGTCGKEG